MTSAEIAEPLSDILSSVANGSHAEGAGSLLLLGPRGVGESSLPCTQQHHLSVWRCVYTSNITSEKCWRIHSIMNLNKRIASKVVLFACSNQGKAFKCLALEHPSPSSEIQLA